MRVLILCPLGVKTGGPEALHQLCDALRRQGRDAYLYPTNPSITQRIEEYNVYDAPIVPYLALHDSDVLVTPETFLVLPSQFSDFPNSRIWIWWLSVDNSDVKAASNFEFINHPIDMAQWISNERLMKKVLIKFFNFRKKSFFKVRSFFKPNTEINYSRVLDFMKVGALAQSTYAFKFLKSQGHLKILMLSDYISLEGELFSNVNLSLGFALSSEDSEIEADSEVKTANVVCFNYAKSRHFILKLAYWLPQVEFVPINNMNKQEIMETLTRSDLYLDLGHFPGKDRLPREAILLGCPVLLAKRGSARYLYL